VDRLEVPESMARQIMLSSNTLTEAMVRAAEGLAIEITGIFNDLTAVRNGSAGFSKRTSD
jgi:hypothetical protein